MQVSEKMSHSLPLIVNCSALMLCVLEFYAHRVVESLRRAPDASHVACVMCVGGVSVRACVCVCGVFVSSVLHAIVA